MNDFFSIRIFNDVETARTKNSHTKKHLNRTKQNNIKKYKKRKYTTKIHNKKNNNNFNVQTTKHKIAMQKTAEKSLECNA